jgi:penicillin-binding protein 1C
LSLILGGGETTLWELAGAYASMARVLVRYNGEKRYLSGDYHPPVLLPVSPEDIVEPEEKTPPLSAGSIWLTLEALRKVNRPETETGWQYFSAAPEIAWKTGTSFGLRDGWAVGTTPGYVIGVWTGNADGEGRPGITGISAAAPILFDLAGIMEKSPWFSPPQEDMTVIQVCRESGFRAGPDCPNKEEISICINGLKSRSCPYHRVVHLDLAQNRQVTDECVPVNQIVNEKWFVLPPAMEYFYRHKHPDYKPLPPFAKGCLPDNGNPSMEFIYPTPGIRIFIPRDHTGELTRIVGEVIHRNPSKRLFWHLDERYMAVTKDIHQTEFLAPAGTHTLTVVDEDGTIIKCSFMILAAPGS